MIDIVFSLYCLLTLFVYITQPNKHEIKVRRPLITIAMVLTDLVAINIVATHEIFRGARRYYPCQFILWYGNMQLTTMCSGTILRAIAVVILSDRSLRMSYRWITNPKWECIFILSTFIVMIFCCALVR